MATQPHIPTLIPSAATPVERILSKYDRPHLAAFITVAIDLLDALGPDPEAEELQLEDGFVAHDPIFAAQDEGGRDAAYPEWQSRGRYKLSQGKFEMPPGPEGWHEDAEEDDSHDDSEGDCEHDGRQPEDGF